MEELTRKYLIEFLEELSKLGKNTNFYRWSKADCAIWLDWLEKQGESSVMFTKADVVTLYEIIKDASNGRTLDDYQINYLESLKQYIEILIKVRCGIDKKIESLML